MGQFSGIAFTAERCLPPAQRTSADGLKQNGFAEHPATVLRGAMEAARSRRWGAFAASSEAWHAIRRHRAFLAAAREAQPRSTARSAATAGAPTGRMRSAGSDYLGGSAVDRIIGDR